MAAPQPTPAPVIKPWRPAKMTPWYDPRQLARTAVKVAVSTTLGQHADARLVETLASPQHVIHDQYQNQAEIWIDYVADLGDGWDSTYTVAYHVAQQNLQVKAPGGEQDYPTPLPRGAVLIFGGDEVYPTASRADYEQRLLQPYEMALRYSPPPHPDVFAIPGNHDWYDSLASFARLFCNDRWFAGWRTRQKRSYFALHLPHGWWLIGTDVQLESDIDAPQVAYFKDVATRMQPGDRVILCNAEPDWIYAASHGELDPNLTENNLEYLEQKVLQRKIAVFIAGDLHHYRRHEGPGKTQKITAGGGGAFLHPTHGPDVSQLPGGFVHQKSFPDQKTSRSLCWRNLAFPFLNPWFGTVTAVLYVLTAWTVMADVGRFGLSDIFPALTTTLETALNNPGAIFWILTILAGFLFFTDTRSKPYRYIAGTLHGLSHLKMVFYLGWFATYFTVSTCGLRFRSISQLLLAGLIVAAGGWFFGSFLMGLYLLVSLNLFRRHSNEAFSSLQIPDWKNFLRMKIDKSGILTIYPIGIERVARQWKDGAGSGPGKVPSGGTPPELIEDPIVVPGG